MFLITIFVYREGIFRDDTVIFSSDYNTSVTVRQQNALEESLDGSIWFRDYLAGWPDQVMSYNLNWLVFKIFKSPYTALTMAYFLATFLVGVFFYIYLRSMKFSVFASLFGGVSLMLSNHFLTVLFPGHLAKCMTFIWIPLVFLFLRKAVREDAWTNYIYAGFFFGLALQEQFYEGVLFFAALALLYWLALLLKKRPDGAKLIAYSITNWKNLLFHKLGFLALVLVMVMLSIQLLLQIFQLSSYTEAGQGSSQDKWDFATSWSLPPEETIELFVPGVFGWKSGDRELPYWGRMGRPSVPSGLKLNAENVGVATLFLAILAMFFLWRKRGSEASFWFWVIIGTLIFSYGRHFQPLYWLFYQLPYMDTIRNPNKVLWVTMFAFSVLGAMGMHLLFSEETRNACRDKFARFLKISRYILYAFAAAALISFVTREAVRGTVIERAGIVNQSAQGPSLANGTAIMHVLEHIPLAFLIAAIFAALTYVALHLVIRQKKDLRYLAAGLIALVAFDLWLSGKNYVVYTDRADTIDYEGALSLTIQGNQISGVAFDPSRPDPVVEYLKEKTASEGGRVYVLLNQLTDFYFRHYFPYHKISCGNFNPNPRMPARYQEFMRVTGYNAQYPPPEALAQLGNRYVLSLEQSAETNMPLPLLASFPLLTRERMPLPVDIRIYELTNAYPQAWMAYQYRGAKDARESSALLGASSLESNFMAPIIESAAPLTFPQADDERARELMANADVAIEYRRHSEVALSVRSDESGLLVFLDAWHANWEAQVNGEPAALYPVNHLFRGVLLPAGESRVTFAYRQKPIYKNISYAGYALVFFLALGEFAWKRKARGARQNQQ